MGIESVKAVIGIDPGASGAAAIITENAIHVLRFKNQSWPDIVKRLDSWSHLSSYNFIESVGAMRRDKPRTAFIFGENTGTVKGILHALDMRFVEVHCSKWQRHFGLGGAFESRAARKKAQQAKAQELFPRLKVTLDMADAVLIAKYGYDKMFS